MHICHEFEGVPLFITDTGIWPLEMQQINANIGLIRFKFKKNQILRT